MQQMKRDLEMQPDAYEPVELLGSGDGHVVHEQLQAVCVGETQPRILGSDTPFWVCGAQWVEVAQSS